jgi:hypothetical protein
MGLMETEVGRDLGIRTKDLADVKSIKSDGKFAGI